MTWKYALALFVGAWLVRITLFIIDPQPPRPRIIRYYSEYEYIDYDPDALEEQYGVDDLDDLTD